MIQQDLVFSGIGIVTSSGVGMADHMAQFEALANEEGTEARDSRSFSLTEFKPAPLLSDRRLLKSISPIDAIGLVAIEDLRRQITYDAAGYDSWRVGLYVGSPPAHAIDGALHHDAMEASRDAAGRCSIREFGKSSSFTRPTAILSGLPNNALCYGATLLEARGPNSNYNCLEISGHTAVLNAVRAFRRGRLDFAVVGGFAGHNFEPNAAMLKRLGIERAADGAVFLSMEPRQNAVARNAEIYGTYVAGATTSDARGPLNTADDGEGIADAIRATLATGGLDLGDVGLVLMSSGSAEGLNRAEGLAVKRLLAERSSDDTPAVGSLAPIFGNLMEAGGLLELAVCKSLYERGSLPESMAMPVGASPKGTAPATDAATTIDTDKRHVLILRTSVWGEYSCLLIRVD